MSENAPADDLILDIDLNGLEETIANVDGFPADLGRELTLAMNKSLPILATQVSDRAPVFLGHLRAGINHQIISPFPNLVGSVGSPTPYAPVIEYGRKPGKMPPIDAIKFWVHRQKYFEVPEEEEESVAWAIAKNIAKRGFSPKGNVGPTGAKMFKEGLEASEPFIKTLFDGAVGRATARANGGQP